MSYQKQKLIIATKKIVKRDRLSEEDERPDSFYSRRESQSLIELYRQKTQKNRQKFKSFAASYRPITNGKQLQQALNSFGERVKVIGVDTETTGLDPFTSKLRLIQIAVPNHPVLVIDLAAITRAELAPLQQLLASDRLKIGHNLKFDWMALTSAGLSLEPPYYDTYLAARVLTAGLKQKMSLEFLACRLLGVELDKSAQTSNFSGNLSSEQLQYAANDAAILLPLYKVLKHKLARADCQNPDARLAQTARTEFDCLRAVAQMELNGVYLALDKWQKLSLKLRQQQTQLQQQIQHHLITDPTSKLLPELLPNINLCSPQQIIAAFNQLGIEIKSTSVSELIPLANDYPVVRWLLEYRSLTARINTFSCGLPQHIHPVTGRIHGHWWQIGARSGRFSCREPNLTNIPRDRSTRQCFTATPGHVIIKADYSQIELRLMAKASGDRRMMAAYRHGKDLHKLTASFLFERAIQDLTDEERKLGKIVNFGLIYGMGVAKFCLTTAKKHEIYLSKAQASNFRQKFFALYRGVAAYHQRIRREWQAGTRVSYSLDGRRRLWSKRTRPTLNELLNHPIQGTNATIIKRAIALLDRTLFVTVPQIKLILVVHDEIVLEVPRKLANRTARCLRKCMMEAAKPILTPVPVEVEVEILENWGDRSMRKQ